MKEYFKLMRVKNYIKNFLIFIPFIFSKGFYKIYLYDELLLGFFIFCFCSSVVYIINDLLDLDKDRLDIYKRNRPLVKGTITKYNAIILVVFLLFCCICGFIFLHNIYVVTLSCCYVLLNILYSVHIKHIPILDVFFLSSFFLIRIYFGAYLINVPVSLYLYLTVLSVALMMGVNKRKIELKVNKDCRVVLDKYSIDFLNQLSYMFCCLSIVFYSIWATNYAKDIINHTVLCISILLVVFILVYYQYIIDKETYCGNPVDILFGNKYLLVITSVYCILMLIGLVYV